MPTNLAVVPARAGSTRLKHKNIYNLGGKPLIRWITEAVIASDSFDKILISTDGDHIFDSVRDLPVERHHRPENRATVKSTVLDAMIDLMEDQSLNYDTFSYFLPTCPFISSTDIQNGLELLTSRDSTADSVVSVTEYQDPIQLACIIKGDDVIPVFDNLTAGLTNSKFIQKYHKPSGAFYMAQWKHLKENKNFFKGCVKGVKIPQERSIDIDDFRDIEIAEFMLKKNERN